jgi:phosphoribosyl-ATP pyrophosphohydrolase
VQEAVADIGFVGENVVQEANKETDTIAKMGFGKCRDKNKFLNEAADLFFHYLILLRAKDYSLKDVEQASAERHQ